MVSSLLPLLLMVSGTVSGTAKLANGNSASQAVVWLDGETKSKPLSKAVVDQRNRAFVPHISVVTVGTDIQFPNNDTVFHNVFAAFDAKKFDLGLYPRGKTKTQSFGKEGLVAVMCSIHSEMSAFVMVVDTPFYTIADNKGAFKIADVSAGKYLLKVWHETGEVYSQELVVSGNQSVEVRTKRK